MDSKDLTDTAKDIISKAPNWNFEGDCLILQWMEQISQNLESRGKSTLDSLNKLSSNITHAQIALENTQNSLTALQYTQYVEMRCQEDEKETEAVEEVEIKKPNQQEILKTFLQNNIKMLNNCHDKFNFVEESDDEDNATSADNCIYQPRNPYNERLLPHIYGTKMWKEQSYVGLSDDSILDYSGDEKSEVYSISSSSESVGQESLESNNTVNTSQWTSSTSLNNEFNNNTKAIKIATNISQTPSVSSSPLNPTNSNIPTNFVAPIPMPRESISENKSQQQLEPRTEQNIAEPTAQQHTGAIKKRTLNLFDDNDYKNLISEFVDKTQTKNEKPKNNLFVNNDDETLTKPTHIEKPIQQHQATSQKVNLFDNLNEDITVIKTGTDLFDKLEQPEIPQTAFKKTQISAKSLFDDDDEDDFLNFFSKKKQNVNPTSAAQHSSTKAPSTALFDGDDVVDKQAVVHTQVIDNSDKPTTSDSKNSSTIKTSKSLFFDDEDNDDYIFAKPSIKTNLEKSLEKPKIASFPVYLATEPPEDIDVPIKNKEISQTKQTKNFNVDNDSDDDFKSMFGNQKPKQHDKNAEATKLVTPNVNLFAENYETPDFNQIMSKSSVQETKKENKNDEQTENNAVNRKVNSEAIDKKLTTLNIDDDKDENFENMFSDQKSKEQDRRKEITKQTVSPQNLFAENDEVQEPENLYIEPNNIGKEHFAKNDTISVDQNLFSNNTKTAASTEFIDNDSDSDFDNLFKTKVNKTLKATHGKVKSSNDIEEKLSFNATEKSEIEQNLTVEGAINDKETNQKSGKTIAQEVAKPLITTESKSLSNTNSSKSTNQTDTFSFRAWLTEPPLDELEETIKTTEPVKPNEIEAKTNIESADKPATLTRKLQLFEDDYDDENDFISTLKNQAPKAKPRVIDTVEPQKNLLAQDPAELTNSNVNDENKNDKELKTQKPAITENAIFTQEPGNPMTSSITDEDKIDKEFKTQEPTDNDNTFEKLEASKLRNEKESEDLRKVQDLEGFEKTKDITKIDNNSPTAAKVTTPIATITTELEKKSKNIKTAIDVEKTSDSALQIKTQVFDNFSPLFLDEPPDDDDFLQTLSGSSSNIVNTQYSVDNDFYEPNLKTSNQNANIDLKSDELNQTNIVYNIRLFNELPPEDEQSNELTIDKSSTHNLNQTNEKSNTLNNLFVADKFPSIFDESETESVNIFKTKELTEKVEIEKSPKSITGKIQTLENLKTKSTTTVKESPPMQTVSKLKLPQIDINVQALLPNAKAKPFTKNENNENSKNIESIKDDIQPIVEHQKTKETTSTTSTPDYSNDPNKAHILPSLNKNRVRLPVKRRSSTRAGRQESYRQTLQVESKTLANLSGSEEDKVEEKPLEQEKPLIGDSLFKKVKIKTTTPSSTTAVKQTISPPVIVPTQSSKTTASKQSPPAFMQSPLFTSSSDNTKNETTKKLFSNNGNLDGNDDDDFFNKLPQPKQPKATSSNQYQKPNEDDELFSKPSKTTALPALPSAFVKPPASVEPLVNALNAKNTKTEISSKLTTKNDNDDDADDDFFSKLAQPNLPKVTSTTISKKPTPTTSATIVNTAVSKSSIEAEDSEDDLFSSSVVKKVTSSTTKTTQKTTTFKSINQPKTTTISKSKALFDSDSNDEDNDNDLFSAAPKPTKPTFQAATKTSKPLVAEASKANTTQKLQSQTKSLFSDSEDDNDDDLFGSSAAKSKIAHASSKTPSVPRDPLGSQRSQLKNQQKVKVTATKTADNPLADLLDE